MVVLPKPLAEDLTALRPGKVLWGWPHCVQNEVVTQVAIDRRLTLIAWEAMNHWTHDGSFSLHVFHKNNELAAIAPSCTRCSLIGTTGAYGRRLRAVVISFGATARGAVAGAPRARCPRRNRADTSQRPGGRGADARRASGPLRA